MKKTIVQAIQSALSLEMLHSHIKNRDTVELSGFKGSTLSATVALLQHTVPCMLVITDDMERAASIASDLGELDPERSVLIFPATNRKPYDREK